MKKLILIIFIILITFLLHADVQNSDKPAKGNWDLKLKQLWQVESAGKHFFAEIQNIKIAPDKKIFIADTKNQLIFIFDSSGKFLNSFGKRGEGPGEIRNYFGGDQLHIVSPTVIFTDRGRIHYFSLDGKYKKTAVTPPRLRPRKYVSENLLISAPATVDDPSSRGAEILLHNIKDNTQKVITRYQPFKKATNTQESSGRQVTVGIVVGGLTPLMIVYYNNNLIYYGMSSEYKINITDLEGRTRDSILIPGRKPKPVSQSFLSDLKTSLADVPADMLKTIMDGLPSHATFFEEIYVDEHGLIYVFVSNPDGKNIKAIDVFSPKGKYIYSTEIKVAEHLTIQAYCLDQDLLILALEDEEGNLSIAKYSVQLPMVK